MLNYLFHWVIPLRSELKKNGGGTKKGTLKQTHTDKLQQTKIQQRTTNINIKHAKEKRY